MIDFKNINLSFGKKKLVVPYKKTMNLVEPDVPINWVKVGIIAGVLVVVAIVAMKFGILDPLDAKNDAILERSTKESQYASLNTRMAEYSKVEEKYGRYSYGWMNENESSMLEKEEVLRIVEEKIASACTIESLSIASNTMSLSISGITLDEGREIVKQLKEDANVKSAAIYSAVSTETEIVEEEDEEAEGTEETEEKEEKHLAKISMTVIFQKEVIE